MLSEEDKERDSQVVLNQSRHELFSGTIQRAGLESTSCRRCKGLDRYCRPICQGSYLALGQVIHELDASHIENELLQHNDFNSFPVIQTMEDESQEMLRIQWGRPPSK